jgi:bifunctional non-homologous end joining protein LigD
MTLAKYRRKRHFRATPEPQGKKAKSKGALLFVVQKHAASHLHYDFRLELDGVLKSWAVPKGPSMKPADRRLAIMVEDHPFEYRTFEGTIPAGNYGAGTVEIWDEGTYHSRQSKDRAESERELRKGLAAGHLTFVLDGKKLKGEFALIRLQHGKRNEWILLKKRDQWAKEVSGGDDDAQPEARGRKQTARKSSGDAPATARRRGAGSHARVKPMLATLVREPFDRQGWLFEVKWDGYRAIADVRRGHVSLYSRNEKPFDARFPSIVESLTDLGHDAILDGEVVVLDNHGRSSFQLLQNYQKTGKGRLLYYVFDILSLDGRDLRHEPLRKRKVQLASLLKGIPNVLFSEHVEGDGTAFFEAAREKGLEGIVAKDGSSPYREGQRTADWLKIKTHDRQEAVIGGFTEPRRSRKDLGALVLGVYENDRLVYIGHTGGGFNQQTLSDLRKRLEKLERKECPFAKRPKTNAPVHWVKPEHVCEVSFQSWTDDGIMRMPIFVGLREDKPARSVHRETARKAVNGKSESRNGRRRSKTLASTSGERNGDNATPTLTNLAKIFWPEDGYTKGSLIEYYRSVSSVILPYLRDRPESLLRHPNGIEKKGFFQKDVSGQPPPDWVETVMIASESAKGEIQYVVCQDEASLLYLVNLGCVELNPWLSRVESLDRPDFIVIDLDPLDTSFEHAIEAAQIVRKSLEAVGGECFCKTSGKRGLHVCIPLGARYDYSQAGDFAQALATHVHQQLRDTTSIVRSPSQRKGLVYLDFLQNRRGQTLAAPYCVRPWPGATVSAPVAWREVRKGLDPAKFTIETMPRRIDKLGDLWTAVLGPGIDLDRCRARLDAR